MMAPCSDASIGLYVHLPFCRQKCRYCGFYSVPIDTADPQPVLEAILAEWDWRRPPEPLETLYVGGGSPNVLGHDKLCRFLERLVAKLNAKPLEFTVEISPPQTDTNFFRSLLDLGVNRISIGSQSFHPDELRMLGRQHSPLECIQTVGAAFNAGFVNIGLDLIAAIPASTPKTLMASIQQAIDLKVAHLSLYCLEWEPHTPLTALRDAGKLAEVDPDLQVEMLTTAQRELIAAGFQHYEISNYARTGFSCRHNIRYWKNLPVVGIGPAASSWYEKKRTDNIPDIQEYVSRIKSKKPPYRHIHQPTPLEIACQTAILGLRMADGIALAEFYQQTGFDFETLFAPTVAEHLANGVLEKTPTHIRLTRPGLWLADTVARDLILEG